MHVPMPFTPTEMMFDSLVQKLDAAHSVTARQKAVQDINVGLVENAAEVAAPENDILSNVVASYLKHAHKATRLAEKNYFIDSANEILMRAKPGERHDMDAAVLATLPFMDPAKIKMRHAILVKNLANVAVLSQETKRELVEVTYRFNGLEMQPQDADELALEGMEPLDAQSVREDLEHLIVGDEYLTTPTPRVQELRYV